MVQARIGRVGGVGRLQTLYRQSAEVLAIHSIFGIVDGLCEGFNEVSAHAYPCANAVCVVCGTSTRRTYHNKVFSCRCGEHTKGIGANLFKELAEDRTQGRVKVTIFPNASVADDDEIFDALIHDEIQLAAPSFGKFSEWTDALQVFELPFLFKDINAVHQFQSSPTGQTLLDTMVDQGIQGLAYWDNG